jgi:1-deoxy-D-xylulose-5-phosphate reductoisomerase
MVKHISILGSTGSIGIQTLQIISAFPEKFAVRGLAAGANLTLLKEQILAFRPKYVSVKNPKAHVELHSFVKQHQLSTEILTGESDSLRYKDRLTYCSHCWHGCLDADLAGN